MIEHRTVEGEDPFLSEALGHAPRMRPVVRTTSLIEFERNSGITAAASSPTRRPIILGNDPYQPALRHEGSDPCVEVQQQSH